MDFYPGAYPARFGRFAGGILSGDAVPPADKIHGELSVRILDTGALIETPFANGHGYALISRAVRLSRADPVRRRPERRPLVLGLSGPRRLRFNDGSRISLFGFGSFDSVSSSSGGGPLQQVLGIAFDR